MQVLFFGFFWLSRHVRSQLIDQKNVYNMISNVISDINYNPITRLRNNKHSGSRNYKLRRHELIRCGGSCKNVIVCSLTGGVVFQHEGKCPGFMTVCCHDKFRRSRTQDNIIHSLELIRVPRQLTPSIPTTRQVIHSGTQTPRQPRFVNVDSNSQEFRPTVKKLTSFTSLKSEELLTNEISDIGHVGHNGHDYHDVPDVHDGGCGRSRDISQSRILGGQEAGYGQFPWSAMIHITSDQFGLDKSCAGTLVHDRYILTAGHCVHYCKDGLFPNCTDPIPVSQITFKVVLGQYDLLNFPKDDSIQRYYAKKIHLHPNFTNIFRLRDDGFLESEPTHDVALLLLDRHVKPRLNIGSVCLPSPSLHLHAGTLGTVTGWGRLGVHEGAPHSSTLQAVTVPILTKEECVQEPGASVPSGDQVCAGRSNTNKSACPGDSGGALMIRDEQLRWTIVGIVSTGPAECGVTPVIYHNVITSIPWILQTLQYS